MSPASPLPDAEFIPESQDRLREFLAENFAGARRALVPAGGKTALDFGLPLTRSATVVPLTALGGVIDYPARDMTITVEAGLPVDRLAVILREESQRLPIDVPQSDKATIGGAVACNVYGPRRFGFGTFRDYLIGVKAVAADGRVFHSGGRVVKNVAGYDLCKLLIGSLGTLAFVTELTFKVKPAPESSVLVWAVFSGPAELDAAAADLLTSATRPVAIEACNPTACAGIEGTACVGLPTDRWLLFVGFEGSTAETRWQIERWRQELSARRPQDTQALDEPASARLWTALANFTIDAAPTVVFQANLLPSQINRFMQEASRANVALVAHAGDGVVLGKLPNDAADPAQAAAILTPLFGMVADNRGSLFYLRCDPDRRTALPRVPISAPGHRQMVELKQALDPADLLSPGRLFAAPSRALPDLE
jgi:glycolate oxidase FAD binding subunit